MSRVRTYLSLAIVGIGLALACSGQTESEARLAELRSERRALLMQFFSAQSPIREYQARALDEEGVRAAVDSFYATLRAVVERDQPEAVELLERARAVGADLEMLSTPVILRQGQDDPQLSGEERRAVVAELAEVERRLRPVIERAFTDPEVQADFGTLRDSVIAGILRQDPGAQASLDLMSRLERQIVDVDQEIASLQGD